MAASRRADWFDRALHALFAPHCVACQRPIGPQRQGPVCAECWQGVPAVTRPWCSQCGEPLPTWTAGRDGERCRRCRTTPPVFDAARAAGLYAGSLRGIVHALKYHGHQSLDAPLGALLCEHGGHMLRSADAVVPVPLHPWRQFRRGFNQADALARRLARPVWRPLRRRRHGRAQADLNGEARLTNVRGAFAVRAGIPRRSVPAYVVLIDDVMTTGATLDACSAVLRSLGVEWIGALTVARAATLGMRPVAAGRPHPRPRAPHPSRPLRR